MVYTIKRKIIYALILSDVLGAVLVVKSNSRRMEGLTISLLHTLGVK